MLLSRHCTPGTQRFDIWFGKWRPVYQEWKVKEIVEGICDNALHATYSCMKCTSQSAYAFTLACQWGHMLLYIRIRANPKLRTGRALVEVCPPFWRMPDDGNDSKVSIPETLRKDNTCSGQYNTSWVVPPSSDWKLPWLCGDQRGMYEACIGQRKARGCYEECLLIRVLYYEWSTCRWHRPQQTSNFGYVR